MEHDRCHSSPAQTLINDNLVRMARMITDLRHATNATGETLQKAEEDKFALFRQVRDREEKADRLKESVRPSVYD